jgi:hypothetical protein
MNRCEKHPDEQFYLGGSILRVQQSGETITNASSSVSAVDKDGTDVTSTVLDTSTKGVVTHDDSTGDAVQNVLRVLVRAGTEAASPYKLKYTMVTNMSHTWVVTIHLYIVEPD